MYYLKTEASFDAAHFLKDYEGKCGNLHGHRWRITAEIRGEKLREDPQERGMLMDFGTVKKVLKDMADSFDHALIIEAGSLKDSTLSALKEEGFRIVQLPFRPTAENFARWFYEALAEKGFPMHRVEVYETPGNMAAYEL